jgi:GNAT superfamily N-acetyltransferase
MMILFVRPVAIHPINQQFLTSLIQPIIQEFNFDLNFKTIIMKTEIKQENSTAAQLVLRNGKAGDAEAYGTICYQAFKTIADAHHFSPDFPTPETAIGLFSYLLSNNAVYSVVAEIDGRPAGSNFLWESDSIAGVGPITVDPAIQNISVGRQLMDAVMKRAKKKNVAGVRLVQAAYHNRSLSLYTKLGFDAREPLSVMQGSALKLSIQGYTVRPAILNDLDACNELAFRLHGFDRNGELIQAIQSGNAMIAAFNGRITGYTTGVAFFGHSVAETNDSLKALIGAAENFSGPGFLLPTRNADLLRWCLHHGLKIIQPMTLMSTGLYNEPKGAFLPSILF